MLSKFKTIINNIEDIKNIPEGIDRYYNPYIIEICGKFDDTKKYSAIFFFDYLFIKLILYVYDASNPTTTFFSTTVSIDTEKDVPINSLFKIKEKGIRFNGQGQFTVFLPLEGNVENEEPTH